MIYDTLSNLGRYRGLSPALDTAIDFLTATDLSTLPAGRTTVDGDTVYINHFSYETATKQPDTLFESHDMHLDLHIALCGRERMAITAVDRLTQVETRPDEDSVMYTGDADYTLPLSSGVFALVYPGEGHLPHLLDGDICHIDKLVCKIRT